VSRATLQERLATKTPEAAFLQVMKEEFRFSPRVSSELLNTAKEMLIGSVPSSAIRPGQVRLVVTGLQAPFGPPLVEADKVEVTLTLDAGAEDVAVQSQEGSAGVRRGRILRLTEEALEQGGVLTQEDLARVLKVSPRTIRRDVRTLKAEGHVIQTRGFVKGVGRGQTHKVRVIELWLDREGYVKIARWLHHSPQAIKRYVSAFLRIVVLYRQGTPVEEIAFLTRTSERLVQDYVAIYEAALEVPHRREKLEEELVRVSGRRSRSSGAEKRAVVRP
jgi:DNA-binding Lrp family transcriptional regulator